MKLISRSEVEANLGMADCIALMRSAMIASSAGEATQPPRQFLPIPNAPGKLALMPGTMARPACFGVKLVAKYQRRRDDPLGTHVGMVILFESASGLPLAMIEGSALTGIRTAAASGLATDLLARTAAGRLAMIGTGEQAGRHIAAMCVVRTITSITVWGRDRSRASAFAAETSRRTGIATEVAETTAQAVAEADIICTTTSAVEPVLSGAALRPGQHLNLVGSAIPTSAEVDIAAVRRARFFVDSRDAALLAAGELRAAIEQGWVDAAHIVGEIGEVAAGRVGGRSADSDITIYKSLGIAAQDLAAAHYLWSRSCDSGEGRDFDLLG